MAGKKPRVDNSIPEGAEEAFRDQMGLGKCVAEAQEIAGLTEEQVVWICRRDPIFQRLVDQEVKLDDLLKQSKLILNDATNPRTAAAWPKVNQMAAAKLIIETVKTVNPDLLKDEPTAATNLDDIAKDALGASDLELVPELPGSDTEQ